MLSMRMGADDKYIDKREIAREVREANRIIDEYGWESIDVSYKAIEEIARRIMILRGFQRRSRD